MDRILQRQKAERQAAEDQAREKAKQTALVSHAETEVRSPPPLPPNKPLSPTNGSESTLVDEKASRSNAGIRNSIVNWKDRFTGAKGGTVPGALPRSSEEGSEGRRSPAPQPPPNGLLGNQTNGMPLLPPPRPSASRPATPGPSVTPKNNISKSHQLAITLYGINSVQMPTSIWQFGPVARRNTIL